MIRHVLKPDARVSAALLVAVIAAVHLQQYIDFISRVPTVGVLFLLNAAGGAGLAVALLSGDRVLRLLAAVGSVGLAVGSLVSVAVAMASSLFGYSEPALRLPMVIAIAAEVVCIPVLAVLVLTERYARTRRAGRPRAARR